MNSTTVKPQNARPSLDGIDELIRHALEEDIGRGDITTNRIIPPTQQSRACWKAKQEGVIAGLFIGRKVFEALDETIHWKTEVAEGAVVKPGDVIATLQGSSRAVLTGERTALNFVQRMSGIATQARQYAQKLEGSDTKVLDTRKTLPGFRVLDKYAVKTGGGQNHRMGLYDRALIKENHIAAAGSIMQAVEKVRLGKPRVQIEVETTSIEQVKEAVAAGADIIMLDNMNNTMMNKAVGWIAGRAQTEASGNVTLDRLEAMAATGVDYISVGALTHSVKAFDISQLIIS